MIMKGADTVLLEKLTPECRKVWDSSAKSKFRSFTQEGKRLLVWAYKIIDSDDPEWTKFVALAGSGRDIAETTWSSFERNMRLAGFTVVCL
jgi:magnesium-transporting ATPase (P-type)